jgi:hypothetical protein
MAKLFLYLIAFKYSSYSKGGIAGVVVGYSCYGCYGSRASGATIR